MWTPVHGFVYSRSHNAVWMWDAASNSSRMMPNAGLVPLEARPQLPIEDRVSRSALCMFILDAVAKVSMPFVLGKCRDGKPGATPDDLPFFQCSATSLRLILTLMTTLRQQVLEDQGKVHGFLALLEVVLVMITRLCDDNVDGSDDSDLASCLSELMQECLETMDAFPYNFPKCAAIHELCNRVLVQGLPVFLPSTADMVHILQSRLVDTPFAFNKSVFLSALLRALGERLLVDEDFPSNLALLSPVLAEIMQISAAAAIFQLDEQGHGEDISSAMSLDLELSLGARPIVTEEETKSEKNSLLHALQRHEVEINTTGTYLDEVGSSCSTALIGLVLSGCTYVTRLITAQDATTEEDAGSTEDDLRPALDGLMRLFAQTVEKSNQVLRKALATLEGGAESTRVEQIVQRSAAGRLLPCFCGWLEFLMRSRNGQRLTTLALLNTDPSFVNITALLQSIVKFTSACPGADGGVSSPSSSTTFSWLQRSVIKRVVESAHPYSTAGHGLKYIHLPNAAYMTVSFDERSETNGAADCLRFLRVRPDGSTVTDATSESLPVSARFGAERYSGRSWPGVCGAADLLIPAGQCAVSFDRESSEAPKWGYRCTVRGYVVEHREVKCLPWQTHLLELCSDFVSTIIFATIGTRHRLIHEEATLVRWVQNPIMSGGLRGGTGARASYERLLRNDSVTRFSRPPTASGARRRSRRSRSRQRARSSSANVAEGETLLAQLTKVAPPTEGPAAEVFRKLRALRVPLDQGFYTHRLACCVFAALVKVNGVEKDVAALAQTPGPAPSKRVQRLWMQAQQARKWVGVLDIYAYLPCQVFMLTLSLVAGRRTGCEQASQAAHRSEHASWQRSPPPAAGAPGAGVLLRPGGTALRRSHRTGGGPRTVPPTPPAHAHPAQALAAHVAARRRARAMAPAAAALLPAHAPAPLRRRGLAGGAARRQSHRRAARAVRRSAGPAAGARGVTAAVAGAPAAHAAVHPVCEQCA